MVSGNAAPPGGPEGTDAPWLRIELLHQETEPSAFSSVLLRQLINIVVTAHSPLDNAEESMVLAERVREALAGHPLGDQEGIGAGTFVTPTSEETPEGWAALSVIFAAAYQQGG